MQSPAPLLRIGTRGSPLALFQARLVRARLMEAHGLAEADIEIVVIATSGDRLREAPLSEFGGKGLFSREIEEALLGHKVDIGVHSSKDMATTLPEGLVLPVFLPREDVRDAFISLDWPTLESMPEGARFGTSSIRRAAQIRRRRPDLEIVPFRGNVETRLRKLAEGVADATLLAGAGLNRLGMADRARQWLDPRAFLPAPAQGAIGIEYRAEDARMAALVAPLNHAETAVGVRAERALLKVLDGSCRTPIGALAELYGARLVLTGELLSPDGAVWHRATLDGEASDPEALGAALGRRLMERAGPEFLKLF